MALPHHKAWSAVVVVGGWLVGALVFFYAQWSSGFNRLMGNTSDTRLMVYLNEHWYQTLRGAASWKNPSFFFPVKGTLGYTDSFFLWQVFYAPFRLLGADPFLAFQLTIVTLSVLTFMCFVILARRIFHAPLSIAIVGALLFTFANSLADHAGSAQVFGIYFVPPIILLGLWTWQTRATRPLRSVVLGLLTGALGALLLFSNYYVAWFSLFSAVIITVVIWLISPRQVSRAWAIAGRSGWRSILGLAVGFGVGIVPFAVTYLPVARQLGVRRYSDAITYSIHLTDLRNLTGGNLLWGHFLGVGQPPGRVRYEASYTITPFLSVGVLLGAVLLVVALVTRRLSMTPIRRFLLAVSLVFILLSILPVETSLGSLWALVWHVPGATAIRAIDRIELANDLAATIALVGLATEAIRSGRTPASVKQLSAVLAVIFALALVEQVHDTSVDQWSRDSQVQLLDSVPPAPPSCDSFYVTDSQVLPATAVNLRFDIELQTEAMVISEHISLPTINGYSGETPPGWGALYPDSPDYISNVANWSAAHDLTGGICRA